MIGDRLIITRYHRLGASRVMKALGKGRLLADGPLAVSIGGESGSGKSEIASCVAALAAGSGKKSVTLCQDDYFRHPPRTNHQKRLENIGRVGPREVRLDLLDAHVLFLKNMGRRPLEKPLAYFDEDRIGSEMIMPEMFDLIIVEGTYTTLLKNADFKVFIDRHHKETRDHRTQRGRETDMDFLHRVLEIESREIQRHREMAHLILGPPVKTGAAGQAPLYAGAQSRMTG